MGNPKNDLGALPRDANNNPVPSGTGILTLDSLRSSPFSIISSAIFDFVIPATAVEITMYCDEDLRLSEDPAMATYFLLPKDTSLTMGVARLTQLFFKLDSSSTALLNFFYTTV